MQIVFMKLLREKRMEKGHEKLKKGTSMEKATQVAKDVIRDMDSRITLACRSGRVLDELNISGLFLKELPPQAKFVRFARIKAGNNLFEEIPSHLSTVTRLQSLDFRHNRLESIPEYLLGLTCLKGINLSDNCIRDLPAFVMTLNTITTLNLSMNYISSFDVPPECLQNLDSLRLSYNAMSSINVQYCTRLLLLDCSHNPIEESQNMGLSRCLISLFIDNVPMSSFPIGLDAATSLTELSWAGSGLERVYGRGPSSTIIKTVRATMSMLSHEVQNTKTIRCMGLTDQETLIESNAQRIRSGQKLQFCGFAGDLEHSSVLHTIVSSTSRVALSILFSSMTYLPSMEHISGLRQLNVSHNNIEGFCNPLPTLLCSLSITNCKIFKIDDFILACHSLTSIDLSFNEIVSLPSELTKLDVLVQFSCDYCKLIHFPNVLLLMRSLVMMSMRNNRIQNSSKEEFCDPGFSNDVINCIDMSNNCLRQPPTFLMYLVNLRCCSMWNNPLEQPWVQFATGFQTSKWTKHLQTEVPRCDMQFMKLIDESVRTAAFPQMSVHLTDIDISANALTILPPWLSSLINLKLLNAKCNKLTSAASLAGCSGLVRIDLAYNRLRTLPQEAFDEMLELTEVSLDGNPLRHLPQILFSRNSLKTSIQWCMLPVTNQRLLGDHSIKVSIMHDLMKSLFSIQEGVTSLKLQGKRLMAIEEAWFANKLAQLNTISSISIGSNMIAEFPACFTMLRSLTEVDISVNRLKELPQWMAKVRSLKKLVCFSNMIASIKWDSEFHSMREVDISDNKLNEIPEDLSMIKFSAFSARYNSIEKFQSHPGFWGKTLEVLDLEYNSFTRLPKWVSELTSLEYLNLEGNYLESIPLELFSITALQDLRLPSMETAAKKEIDEGNEEEEIATPKSHSVHWLAVLRRLNESVRSLRLDLDDLSLMDLPEQVIA
jgi:Leucine-rich repeat (LRR) protein